MNELIKKRKEIENEEKGNDNRSDCLTAAIGGRVVSVVKEHMYMHG